MPPNNQNRSSGQRLATDLEGPFRKIGIPAVAAAARYSSKRKRARLSNAGGGAAEKERSKTPKNETRPPLARSSGWAEEVADRSASRQRAVARSAQSG